MQTIKFGIMGAGHIAEKFCEAVKLVNHAEVVAVGSRTPGKAEQFAQKNEVSKYYDSYEVFLQDEEVDVVYVATTHNFHFENVKACIEAGKHIICEKCFVLNEQDARALFEAAKAANVFVMEAMWSRFLPAIQKAKEWIEAGEIGTIELAHGIIGFRASDDPKGRILNPELAGGAMYDIGVYMIEIMTYLIEQNIVEVQSMINKAVTGVDKVDNVSIRFESCMAHFQAMVSGYCKGEMKIYGSEGYIVIPNSHYATECMLYKGYDEVEHFVSNYENGFTYQVEEVVRCVQNGQLESEVMPHSTTIQCAALFDKCLNE